MRENFNPIKAKDAREATEAYIQSKNEEQLKSIFDQIAAQVTKGYYSLNVYESISSQNIAILKECGYQINTTSPIDVLYCGSPATLTTISWEKA